MDAGLPVVVTDVGGLGEATRGYDGAVLVPADDKDALREGLHKALALRGQRFANVISWSDNADAVLGLLDDSEADPEVTLPAALTSATGGDIDETEGPELFDEGLFAGSVRLVQRAGIALVVQVIGAGLSYASQVLLARLLGASNYGVYTYVFVWVTFVSLLAGLGFPAASVRFLPVYRVKQDWARISGFTRSKSKFTFATAIAITLVAVVSALLLHSFGALAHPSAILLGALLVPALAGSTLYTEFARAGNRVSIAFIPALIGRPALIGIGAAASI